ncbi:BCS1 protein precursor [Purpureocillium lilacinum]|uniref:BCS1 protein n=1 Tax=Purpureocillium lilacinum TaxID=33203 RepID=A0A179HSM1_PURLI|nr:BCS1 protein precursor [Purpureocillium lilacinum]KAK4088835.1 hypothetical protein Purlil1_6688 [Purpureocillium lilacinum]OAQ92353.1 BCS1 protein precursor [Purpureocillium lilacinum]PWI68874.1 hypothetical protein PCL_01259 [Purpureocillium lilacinum]GJN73629.1 hypothetical protein PLICBS_007711 [Purpureocillium lilacinum]GJN84139.1 hypothetical protein PLIIFM63780_007694 [Purpureocillium lilacinum]
MDKDQQAPAPASTPSSLPGETSSLFTLNYLFPGLTGILSPLLTFLGIDLNAYIPFLVAGFGLFFAFDWLRWYYREFVQLYFVTSASIAEDDEAYEMVMLWLSKQAFSRSSRRFRVNKEVSMRLRNFRYWYREQLSDGSGSDDDVKEGTLHYTPDFETQHSFKYKGTTFRFHRIRPNTKDGKNDREELYIYCYGRNPRVLKELLAECYAEYMEKDARKTLIYRASLSDKMWQRCMSRRRRPFSTVILDESVKKDLLNDAHDYLDINTRQWYANRGIPYRRGYLFHGPPGTGKSSLSFALAGQLSMKIYIVNLNSSSATEETISKLFSELPTRCIVLLEDIDSAGLTHTRDNAPVQMPVPARTPPSASPRHWRMPEMPPPAAGAGGALSLSGLLNILDGVASQEGRILIMTTNHIEKLDKALIRPGRVDRTLHFGLADEAMTASIFRAIYSPYENEVAPSRRGRVGAKVVEVEDTVADEKERAVIRKRVGEQAERFAKKIPELEFSPAEIQGLLLQHKHDPAAAIAAVESWVIRTRNEKKEKAAEEAEKKRKETEEQAKAKELEAKVGRSDDGAWERSDAGGESEAVLNGELEAISTASMESASDAGMTKATVQSDSGYGTP